MKKLLSLLIFTTLIAACTQKTPHVQVRHNVLDSIPTEKPILDKKYSLNEEVFTKEIEVIYEKERVWYSKLPEGVSANIKGKNISFVSKTGGVNFNLSGHCDNGSFALHSDSTVMVTLDGLALASRSDAAMRISSNQVTYLKSKKKTINFLVDAPCQPSADTVKTASALQVTGDIVMCGRGKLALSGKRRSAINCSGRIIIDNGTIAVEDAVRDAICADGGVAVTGGNLRVNATKDAIKSKRGNVLFLGGITQLTATGQKGDGVQASNIYIYDGYVTINAIGNASRGFNAKRSVYVIDGTLSVVTEGSYTFSPKKADYSSSACIKCNNSIYMKGGYLNLENHATAGKGINCNGKMQMDGGLLLVRNTGNDVVHPTLQDAHASAKGIKCDSIISINGGKIEVLVFGEGERCEGIESKERIIIGGDAEVYVYATDDAINCGNNFIVNSGKVYAYSAMNDAIDSNGKITINGGMVVANGSDSPEQGIDCDFDANFCITGGEVISIGGMMGRAPNMPRNRATTARSAVMSGMELKRDKYINLCDEKGKAIISYRLPRNINRGGVIISSPALSDGKSYKFAISDTIEGGDHCGNGVYRDGNISAEKMFDVTPASIVTRVDREGNIEHLEMDTTEFKPGMMPPPPPHGQDAPGMMPPPPPHGQGAPGMMPPHTDIKDLPDSIRKKFFSPDGKPLFTPPFLKKKGADEGYDINHLPGGGW